MLNNLAALGNNINLYCVPGHVNFQGNELADQIAKEAANMKLSGPEPFYPVSMSTIKGDVKQWIEDKHMRQWNSRQDCRQAKLALGTHPNIAKKLISLNRKQIRQVIQIITGHANLAKHLHNCGYTDSPICPACGEEDETPLHYVGRCPAFSIPRRNYFGDHQVTLSEVVNAPSIYNLVNFLNYTKHLNSW